jgi:hypothetical protein
LAYRVVLITLLIVLFVCSSAYLTAAPTQSAGRGSFLSYRANSVSALVAELSSHSAIANRYSRHFGTTPEAVRSYFKDNLRLVTLSKPLKTTIYFVGKDGRIIAGKRLLPAGSRIFATKSGVPVLEWRCGNPLTKRLPQPSTPKPTLNNQQPKVTVPKTDSSASTFIPVVPAEPTVQVASANPIEIGQIPPPTSSIILPMESAQTSVVTGIDPIIETAVAPVSAVPPAILTNAKNGLWALPALLGGVGVFANREHHNPPPPPVPEPASVAVFLTGFTTVGIGWLKRRRR